MSNNQHYLGRQKSLDRFIPRRSGQDIDLAHYRLQKSHSDEGSSKSDSDTCFRIVDSSDSPFNPQTSPGENVYVERLISLSSLSARPRVLSFTDSPGSSTPPVEESTRRESNKNMTLIGSPITQTISLLNSGADVDFIGHNSLDWSINGTIAVAYDKNLFCIELADKEMIWTNPDEQDKRTIKCLSWNSDATLLAIGYEKKSASIWRPRESIFCPIDNFPSDMPKNDLNKFKKSTIQALAWNSDSSCLLAGTDQGYIYKFYFTDEGNQCDVDLIQELHYRNSESQSFGINHIEYTLPSTSVITSGAYFYVVAGTDGSVTKFDQNDNILEKVDAHHGSVGIATWCPWNSSALASCGEDGFVNIWVNGIRKSPLRIESNAMPTCLNWYKAVKGFVTVHKRKDSITELTIWSFPKITKLCSMVDQSWNIEHVCIDQISKSIMTSCSDFLIRFWTIFKEKTSKKENDGDCRKKTLAPTKSIGSPTIR